MLREVTERVCKWLCLQMFSCGSFLVLFAMESCMKPVSPNPFPIENRSLDPSLKYGEGVKYFKTKIYPNSKIHLDKESWNPVWSITLTEICQEMQGSHQPFFVVVLLSRQSPKHPIYHRKLDCCIQVLWDSDQLWYVIWLWGSLN